jgi:hypothetical protein
VRVIAILGDERPLDEASQGQAAGLRLKVTSEDQYRRWATDDETGYVIVGKVAVDNGGRP